MSNLLSYGVSIPNFQIENQVLHPGLGTKKGKRTIIFSDEDPVTLAFDAASQCLESYTQASQTHNTPNADVDAIFFASTTPVFRNRYHASFLAELLDLPKGILALDLSASPRSGSDALILADHLISTNNYHKILVLAADTYFPAIGEELTPSSRDGHAGCSLLVGNQEGIAAVKSAQSYSSFIAEEFIYKGNTVQLDARFGREVGIKSSLNVALDNFLVSGSPKPDKYKAVILNTLYAKSAMGLFTKRGFDLESQLLKDSIQPQTGFTGACHAIIRLIDSLERNSGDILLVDYYNGTNVFHIKQTAQISPERNTLEEQLKDGVLINSYQDYLTLRKAGHISSRAQKRQEMFSSDMMLEREKENVLHLKGFECNQCGTVYFIKIQRCKKCKGAEFTLKKLSKRGVVFSFTKEHYFPSSFPPVTMAVVDLDGGGRLTLQVTDEMHPPESNETLIGAKVKLVLRKMMEYDVKPNYFWKCKL